MAVPPDRLPHLKVEAITAESRAVALGDDARSYFSAPGPKRGLRFMRNLNPSEHPVRTAFFATCALLAFSVAPSTAQQPKPDDGVALQIRLLEERATRAEERLTRLEKATAVVIPEVIPFGDVVVNLAEDRQQRYLRLRIAIRVSDMNHKEMSARVTRKKVELKSWAITFLAGQTTKDVSGSKGILHVQDELKKGFGKILGDGKENAVLDVLFEEYVIQ